MVKISASVLANHDIDTILKLNQTNVDYLHIDIMDGEFVPDKTFTVEELETINKYSKKALDVHLMVNDVDKYLTIIKFLKPDFVTFHFEVLKNLDMLKKIKADGIKCGLSVKPNTDIKDIFYLLDKIDLVLIMSVEPGRGGQKFIDNSIVKIKELREEIIKQKLDTLIAVDGGINDITSKKCIDAGTDILVVGTFITSGDNFQERIDKIKKSK